LAAECRCSRSIPSSRENDSRVRHWAAIRATGRACDACAAVAVRVTARSRAAPGQSGCCAGRERVVALGEAFREIRRFVGDPRQQSAKLDPRQAHQFGECQHAHCFLHRFPAAPIAACWRRPLRRPRRVHRLRPERRGGARGTCAHQAEDGARWLKEGRVWCGAMEEAVAGANPSCAVVAVLCRDAVSGSRAGHAFRKLRPMLATISCLVRTNLDLPDTVALLCKGRYFLSKM